MANFRNRSGIMKPILVAALLVALMTGAGSRAFVATSMWIGRVISPALAHKIVHIPSLTPSHPATSPKK